MKKKLINKMQVKNNKSMKYELKFASLASKYA
mgnify:CR=1 FL=1|jgi:hypothetical protein